MMEIALTIASHFVACALGFILGARWAARRAGAVAAKALETIFTGIEENIRQNEAAADKGRDVVRFMNTDDALLGVSSFSLIQPGYVVGGSVIGATVVPADPPHIVSTGERAWPRAVK